tara:strand:- start:354 stop:1358 length:1005 start_codon:yes stop_codon:yes gene_type:complete
MNNNYFFSRRKFLNIFKLLFIFLLASCTKVSKQLTIGFQKSFFPDSFKNLIPENWNSENINLNKIASNSNEQKYKKLDYLIVNDGWINSIKFDEFKELDSELFYKVSGKSRNHLNYYDINVKNKLFPIGLIPYAVIVKNNIDIKNIAIESWDFLLLEELKSKVILPNSPRLISSIAKRINSPAALKKLINQENIYDDKNALGWLLDTKAIVAIIPYTLCKKYLQMDSRLSLVFPTKGVPLSWQFLLTKSNVSQEPLIKWINSLEKFSVINKLKKDGWFIPFKEELIQDITDSKPSKNDKNLISKECWDNSWSLPPLSKSEEIQMEIEWEKALAP